MFGQSISVPGEKGNCGHRARVRAAFISSFLRLRFAVKENVALSREKMFRY